MTQPSIHWMTRRHLPEVVRIESQSFGNAWNEEQFLAMGDRIGCDKFVAISGGHVVGYLFCDLHRDFMRIINIAVHPEFRRQGIGVALVQKLINRLSTGTRSRISLEVRETNLVAQQFFRAIGFRASVTLKNFYNDTTDDAYLMTYRSDVVPYYESRLHEQLGFRA